MSANKGMTRTEFNLLFVFNYSAIRLSQRFVDQMGCSNCGQNCMIGILHDDLNNFSDNVNVFYFYKYYVNSLD